VERDIVTSQIQTLAVFLGIDDLERLAVSEHPTLKEWLADRVWTQHLETRSGLLADGYDGPEDSRLIAFAKEHLMRFYGGDLGEIIRECCVRQSPGSTPLPASDSAQASAHEVAHEVVLLQK